jgi:hypothetical protein
MSSRIEQFPTETLTIVFGHFSYEELADLRLVSNLFQTINSIKCSIYILLEFELYPSFGLKISRRFNMVCKGQLVYGLKHAEEETSIAVQKISNCLPVRSSQRRGHLLHTHLIVAERVSLDIRLVKRALADKQLEFVHGKVSFPLKIENDVT